MGRTTHAPPPGGGGYATRREAEAALTDLLDRVNKRTHVDAGRQTVGVYLEQWLAGKAALRSTTARGLRRGEAVGLPWINVDLEHGQVVIASQIVQLGWATEQAASKSDSEGVVALDTGTIEVLRTHRERQQAEAAAQADRMVRDAA